ncbi:hypothetical protein M438DRAFT_175909 [Aureobasidium pullulans EXF-150]|uniref:Uncharacterized protein n=1 Tax=Aureobasidium pullulans EXF-150 TaxID=1043002 RepID=A0A074YHR7_AURPU|nr:uncharacterized protein M438DRAFT_175909 [Aureobasidium pullulans EXF-150]KEQ86426.1 hypothetical protein M438DRAFT_175909 [Aureobasidium pullulans EXF-150]
MTSKYFCASSVTALRYSRAEERFANSSSDTSSLDRHLLARLCKEVLGPTQSGPGLLEKYLRASLLTASRAEILKFLDVAGLALGSLQVDAWVIFDVLWKFFADAGRK